METAKHLLTSKTFWLNAASIAANYSGLLPVDPATANYVIAGANIVVRLLTKGPVYVLKSAARE